MILKHYGLREQPFGATPDPRFLFASKMHREALASLLYAIESGRGFTALIAPPGLGKTTLLFHLLESLRGKAKTAFVFQSQCKPRELLRFLLKEFGVASPTADFVSMHHALNDMLAAEAVAGRKCLIVLDEAHNLNDSVLESVRLLSDFETPNRKLLHIVIAGQSELRDRLSQPSLAQLRQRIGVVCKLAPLPAREIDEYIQYRLKAAGYSGPPLFTPAAMAVIRAFSHGIPRNINALCFSAMSLGFALGRTELDAQILEEGVADLSLDDFDLQATFEESEPKECTWRSDPTSEATERLASLDGPDVGPEEAPVARLSAAGDASQAPLVQPTVSAESPDSPEVRLEGGPAGATPLSLITRAEAKVEGRVAQDPLLNIDLSAYALLDSAAPKKKATRVEEGCVDPSRPWIAAETPRTAAAEPELDVLKQRLANHVYPESAGASAMRRDYVVVGLVAATFGAAILTALLWVRPNIGFAMGRSQPEQPAAIPSTTGEKSIAASKPMPPQRSKADVTPVLVTSSAVITTPPPSVRDAGLVAAEETAPPPLPIDDREQAQRLQNLMAPQRTVPQLGAQDVVQTENAVINTPVAMTPPVYPESARQNKLEGTVLLQIVVDKNGKVKRLVRISGDPQLADAAIEAVSQWRYPPTVVDGKRVESNKQVQMTFTLGETGAEVTPQ